MKTYIKNHIIAFFAIVVQTATLSASTLDDAKALYNTGRYADAIPLLIAQAKATPKNQSVQEMLAVSYYEVGNIEEAKKIFKQISAKSALISSKYLFKIAFDEFEFEEAESWFDKYELALKKAKKSASELDLQLAAKAKAAKIMLEHVEKIQVIDSLSVDRDSFFEFYNLHDDAGKILKEGDNVVTYSADGNTKRWAEVDSMGIHYLYESRKLLDGEWTTPVKFDSRFNADGSAIYPYVLPDGITMYFANNGNESIGGYDLFMTRKDLETGEYLQPQNMGMPYNSPYDDYLLVIDEYKGIGWWATDRNRIDGKLTIYVFIPKEMRENYDADDDLIANYASLRNYKLTWAEDADYSQILDLAYQEKPEQEVDNKAELNFEISKDVVYKSFDDFKTPEGKKQIELYLATEKKFNEISETIDQMRSQYHDASEAEKKMLTNKILQAEKNKEKIAVELDYYANLVRRAEKK